MKQISAHEVKAAMDNQEDFVLLDVRTPGEFLRGKIAGAINVPVDEIESKIESVIPDKNKIIYVYCMSASRSPIAVEAMTKLGYKNVYDTVSGLLAWRVYKYPTTT